jgi:hypothetical protein
MMKSPYQAPLLMPNVNCWRGTAAHKAEALRRKRIRLRCCAYSSATGASADGLLSGGRAPR